MEYDDGAWDDGMLEAGVAPAAAVAALAAAAEAARAVTVLTAAAEVALAAATRHSFDASAGGGGGGAVVAAGSPGVQSVDEYSVDEYSEDGGFSVLMASPLKGDGNASYDDAVDDGAVLRYATRHSVDGEAMHPGGRTTPPSSPPAATSPLASRAAWSPPRRSDLVRSSPSARSPQASPRRPSAPSSPSPQPVSSAVVHAVASLRASSSPSSPTSTRNQAAIAPHVPGISSPHARVGASTTAARVQQLLASPPGSIVKCPADYSHPSAAAPTPPPATVPSSPGSAIKHQVRGKTTPPLRASHHAFSRTLPCILLLSCRRLPS